MIHIYFRSQGEHLVRPVFSFICPCCWGSRNLCFFCPGIQYIRWSSVWRVIDMPALFLHIAILSFSLLSLLQAQIHLITRVIRTNIKSAAPPLPLSWISFKCLTQITAALGPQQLLMFHDNVALFPLIIFLTLFLLMVN